ncbi:MAG TPA: phosphotriesterase-related protein [Acidobacteriota bacterium]|nr:phosphotriesterase-related protein [Acidobacteriota bacterium]
MEKTVMTVTGPISVNSLGVTLMHEHITFAYPGWFADDSVAPYSREATETACLKVLDDVKKLGVRTIVDATASDVGGRDPVLMRNLSIKSGIQIIAATGLFPESVGAGNYYKWQSAMRGRNLEADLCELFSTELNAGIRGSGVRAGIIKVATGDPGITDYETTVFKAAVRIARETGVSIITHTEAATVGPDQQDLFLELGADPERIMIGHQNNSEDIEYGLRQLKRPGFYLGFDRCNPLMSAASEENIGSLVSRGYGDRIMLSHDCIFQWLGRPGNFPPQYAGWYPDYLFKKILPKMKAAGVTDEQLREIFVDNPRRFFGGE